MDVDLERALQELLDKQAIREMCLTYARGVDRVDPDLRASIFHEDAIYEHFTTGTIVGSPDRSITEVMREQALGSPLGAKSLLITDTMVEVDGDVAFAESHGLSLNSGTGDDGAFNGWRVIRFLDRFERRDGKTWKIAHRLILHDGFERYESSAPPPYSIPTEGMSLSAVDGHASIAAQPGRYRDDPSYNLRDRLTKEAIGR